MFDGNSFYTVRLDDPQAIYLEPGAFGAVGDGSADDTEAVQAAVDAAQEATGFGLVFVMAGRYRLSRTVVVWAGIRLIGFGARRPSLVLGDATPGFQAGEGRYLLHFASGRPPEGQPVRDANPGTFYSALSNIDIEIGEGNGAAIGVRSHWAQHCYVAHVDFRIGSGRAGIEEVGNEIDDCRFFGGDYGIITTKPSPSWPFLMIDTAFEGQRIAAIRTEEGGMTLVRNRFTRVPTAVSVNPDRAEELFIIDSRFEEVSGPALVISDEGNARMQVNLKNVVCAEVPVLAAFRQSGDKVAGEGDLYRVANMALEDPERGYGRFRVSIDRDALDHLVQVANGDARTLLNALELAVETTPESFPPPEGTEIRVNLAVAEESIQRKAVLYDKEGDYHFDTISAFIKSVRGSDPDAALYWLAYMLEAGDDPRFVARRICIAAAEDVGNADPQALQELIDHLDIILNRKATALLSRFAEPPEIERIRLVLRTQGLHRPHPRHPRLEPAV